jgi:hypothetical protein
LEIIFSNLAVTAAGPTEIFQQHDTTRTAARRAPREPSLHSGN